MAQQNDVGVSTYQAAAATAKHLRVKDNGSSKLTTAGATDIELGTARDAATAADEYIGVYDRTKPGTVRMVASGAVTAFARVYAAASGKITASENENCIGRALEAATADGDVIEVLRDDQQTRFLRSSEAHTAADTLSAIDSGKMHTSVGATGAITLTLPAATAGLEYFFRVGAAQELRLDPNGTETIALPSTGVQGAAGKYLTANADGESLHIMCDTAGDWTCYGYTGTWAHET